MSAASVAAVTVAGVGADPRAVLARHGRSFHHASRLLGEVHADRAARLYAWCRRVDDLADDAGDDPVARARAARRLASLRLSLLADDREDRLAAPLLALADEVGADPRHAVALVEGVAADLDPVALPDERALVRYGHAVAGTVGLLMLPVLGVHDPAARPFAVDLGVGMQLTNIARDVVADARMGRRYVPGTWVDDLPPARLLDPTPAEAAVVRDAVAGTLRLAEDFYASAEDGLAHLPPRPRAAIRVAARVYRRIGRRLAARDHDVWAGRTVVPASVKGVVTVGALGRHVVARRPREHDPALHRHLDGLAGTATAVRQRSADVDAGRHVDAVGSGNARVRVRPADHRADRAPDSDRGRDGGTVRVVADERRPTPDARDGDGTVRVAEVGVPRTSPDARDLGGAAA